MTTPRDHENSWRALRGVAISMTAALVAAGVGAVVTGNGEFLFYIGVLLVLMGAIAALHRRVGLPQGLLWGLAAWGLLHLAGGLVPVPASWPIAGEMRVLYSWWLIPGYLKYDHVVHAYGFGMTTWLCWEGLRTAVGVRRMTLGLGVLCAAGGMGFGALNEVIEFVATLLIPDTNVGGYMNTGWDLVANLSGCIISAGIIASATSRREGTPELTPREEPAR